MLLEELPKLPGWAARASARACTKPGPDPTQPCCARSRRNPSSGDEKKTAASDSKTMKTMPEIWRPRMFNISSSPRPLQEPSIARARKKRKSTHFGSQTPTEHFQTPKSILHFPAQLQDERKDLANEFWLAWTKNMAMGQSPTKSRRCPSFFHLLGFLGTRYFWPTAPCSIGSTVPHPFRSDSHEQPLFHRKEPSLLELRVLSII